MLRISGERSINRVLVLKVLIGLEEGLESDKFNKDTITIISLQQQCSPWRYAQVLECSTGSSAGSKDYLKGQCGRNAWCQGDGNLVQQERWPGPDPQQAQGQRAQQLRVLNFTLRALRIQGL